jgi:hypothetical protein
VSAGRWNTCARLDDGSVKCWGYSTYIGSGGVTLGDGNGEMGDNLPIVSLGTGRSATAVSASTSTCAVLDNATVKCWGTNNFGSAGAGSLNIIGDSPGEMGDSLAAVSLGTGRTAVQIATDEGVTCAVLDNAKLKCWGANDKGQLGLDSNSDRGDGPGEMGDSLPYVLLPAGVVPAVVEPGRQAVCTLTTAHQVYCWGLNAINGRASEFGDAAGEMANLLPIDLGGTPYKALVVAQVAGAPDAPTDLMVSLGATSAVVTWMAPVSNNGAAITGYRIEQAAALGGPWSTNVANTGSTATTRVISGLPAGSTAFVRVRAINTAGVGAAVVSSPLQPTAAYLPLTPFRLADTRPGETTGDGQGAGTGQLAATGVLTVQVTGRGSVPAGAKAAVISVGAVQPAADGFLTVYPCNVARPTASNVNYIQGRTTPNLVVATLSPSGTLCVYSSRATQLIVDVSGAYASSSPYVPLTPMRFADTRPNGQTIDSGIQDTGTVAAGTVLQVQVGGRGGLPATMGAVVLNVTSTESAAGGFLTVFACLGSNSPRPPSSNLNFPAGRTIANAVITAVSGSGTLCVYTSKSTHLIVDVSGFYPAGTGYLPLTPFRLADSRPGQPTGDGQGANTGVLAAGQTLTVQVGGRGAMPANAIAATLNVVAIDPVGDGFVTVYPCDAARPQASNLNVSSQTVASLVIAKLSATGTVCIYTNKAAHIAVDLFGAERL